MFKNANLEKRLDSDRLYRAAESLFDKGEWDKAIEQFRLAIAKTLELADLNKDDYRLLTVCYRDLVWPYFHKRLLDQSLKSFRESLKYFTLAIDSLSFEQFNDPHYLRLMFFCKRIPESFMERLEEMGTVSAHEMEANLDVEMKATFTELHAFLDKINEKYSLPEDSKAWLQELEVRYKGFTMIPNLDLPPPSASRRQRADSPDRDMEEGPRWRSRSC